MSAVCVIPAKGSSRRIPRKNIRMFHGRPIITYSIEAAKASGLFDAIYVSTDDEEIANVSMLYGASMLPRPVALTVDEVGTQEVTKHALEYLGKLGLNFDYACCIYATAPLMSADDLKRGYELLSNSSMNYAMSVGTDPLCDAAQFYWGHASAFLKDWPLFDALTYMVPVAPARVCDINTKDDWRRAESMHANLHKAAA